MNYFTAEIAYNSKIIDFNQQQQTIEIIVTLFVQWMLRIATIS